jgi:hypothetical protein
MKPYGVKNYFVIILDKDMEISFERTDYLKTHLILNTIYHLETIVNENYLNNFVSVLMSRFRNRKGEIYWVKSARS